MLSLTRRLQRAFSTTTTLPKSTQPDVPGFLKSASDGLYKERNLKRLVKKFKQHSESDRFRTKTGIYESTVRRLAAAKRFRWIEEILEHQKQYRDMSKEGFAVRLISLFGKSGMFDQALKVFDEMSERKCDRTVKSFNALLGASVKSKKFEKTDGLFRELPEKLSVKPDVVSYNTLIKAFCEMGSLDSAVAMVDEMEKNELEPDLITFNTLLYALYGNNRFSDGEKIWIRMEGKSITPDIRSYNAKLDGLVSKKKMSEAVHLLRELEPKGLKPDVFSYNLLLKGCCNEGNLEEAKSWYEELLKSNCAPDKITFATVVPFACDHSDFEWVSALYRKIFLQKCIVDSALLQSIVDWLVKESKMEEAEALVQLGKTNSYCRYKLKIPSDK